MGALGAAPGRAGGTGSVMDRLKLSRIDEDLESSEVASLCFLCRDVLARKRLEGVNNHSSQSTILLSSRLSSHPRLTVFVPFVFFKS